MGLSAQALPVNLSQNHKIRAKIGIMAIFPCKSGPDEAGTSTPNSFLESQISHFFGYQKTENFSKTV